LCGRYLRNSPALRSIMVLPYPATGLSGRLLCLWSMRWSLPAAGVPSPKRRSTLDLTQHKDCVVRLVDLYQPAIKR
jgi:hypothetical protein